jgi:hypothetical protein
MDPVILGLIAFAFIAGLIVFFTRGKSKKSASGAGGIGKENNDGKSQDNEAQTT